MKQDLKTAFHKEMAKARTYYVDNKLDLAFSHLERAHVLGQRYFKTHFLSHWWMFKVGIRRGDYREIFGQITRMMAVVPGYLFGWVPKGNTGGADVSPIKPMAAPADLAPLLADYNVAKDVRGRLLIIALLLTLLMLIVK